jgi:hypothetical protein
MSAKQPSIQAAKPVKKIDVRNIDPYDMDALEEFQEQMNVLMLRNKNHPDHAFIDIDWNF